MSWRGIENPDSFNFNRENQDIYDSPLRLKGFLHKGMKLDLLNVNRQGEKMNRWMTKTK